MNIDFSNSANNGVGARQEAVDASRVSGPASVAAQPANRSAPQSPSQLTITIAKVSPEEIAAAEIPDAALSRDDALGRLVGEAFSLPPPQMPSFDKL